MKPLSDYLGKGIYTPAEISVYANIPTQTVNRWLFGNERGEAVLRPEAGGDRRIATFLDFVQVLAVKAITSQYKIPLRKIRQAVENAAEKHGVEFPLARRHQTFVLSDGKRSGHGELVIRPEDGTAPVQLSGKAHGNRLIAPVAEMYMDRVKFGSSGFATSFEAWEGFGRSIRMDPRKRFGAPVVGDSGFSAFTLWDAYRTEGGFEPAADAYLVEPADVKAACGYIQSLRGLKVAA